MVLAYRWIVTSAVAVALVAVALPAAAVMPPSEQIFPATTKAYVSVPSLPKLRQAWERSPLGRLLDDPEMQDFRMDLERQLEDKGMQMESRSGITPADLEGLPTGEIAVGLIAATPDKASIALLIDVTNNLQMAGQTLQKVDATLMRQGAKRVMHPNKLAKAPLTEFIIPPKGKRKKEAHVVYFIENEILAAFDNLATAEDFLTRIAGTKPDSLAGVTAFKTVMERTKKQVDAVAPHVRWWADPLTAAEAVQVSYISERGNRDPIKIARNVGFSGIKAVGGLITMSSKPYGMLHRTMVLAPPPYQSAMKMLDFPNAAGFTPEAWVPAKIDSYSSFQWNLQTAFDNVGPLFDEVVGEGEKGVWQDVIDSMRDDPNGPQLDLRKELVAHLGKRCSMLVDTVEPIDVHSQRRLLAAETTDEAKVAAAIEKTMKNDESVKVRLFETGGKKYKIFEIIPEDEGLPLVDVENGVVPVGGIVEQGDGVGGVHGRHPHIPHSAVTVGLGCLLISSHVELLEEILSNPKVGNPLDADKDYKEVLDQFPKLNAGQRCAQSFTRNDDRYRVQYEMFKQGRMPEAEMPLAQALNAILSDESDDEVRKQRLDGHALPDYKVVRQYLSTAGTFIQGEADGWLMVGFTLDNKK